jgi:hypothetical protein
MELESGEGMEREWRGDFGMYSGVKWQERR